MAYAAYREFFTGHHHSNSATGPAVCAQKLLVLDVTVPSCDAFQLRGLLACIPQTGVLRCIPRLHDNMVMLEVKLPENRVNDVLHVLMTDMMNAEIGALTSWKRHMAQHGLTHGF